MTTRTGGTTTGTSSGMTTPGTGGPLSAVLEAFGSGAGSLAEVAARSGLSPEVVRAAVDHLVRMGRLEAKELALGCPTGGCGSCASGTPQGAAGCGAPGPSGRRSGPVLVTIGLRRS
ncbi:MAG TPA: FeoC-like transcriptional regulator [Phycicoccus sp.]|nr:FeoC-like transcriptional regulator [Phycicoccus sp.]